MSVADPRIAALALAKAELEHEITQAVEIACEPLDEDVTPERLDGTHRLIACYVNLARIYIDRFEEVARGT